MKTKYITPAVSVMSMAVERRLLDLSYGNQEGDGEQLSKDQDFFDDKAVIDHYIPDAFANVFPKEEE
jgi:hypothetical protein